MLRSSSEHFRASGVAIAIVFGLTGCATPELPQQRASDTTMIALNDGQLGEIRGGFDVAPNLSVTFGFQQITSLDHQIVSSVIVPNFTFSPASQNGADPFSFSSSFGGAAGNGSPNQSTGGSNPSTLASGNSNTGSSANTTQTNASGLATNSLQNALSTTSTSSGGSKSSSAAQIVVPTVVTGVNTGQSATTTAGTQNQGVTTILTQLGGGGLTNIVGNTANNALVQQVTTINLAISGLQQLLNQHVNSAVLTNALLQSRLLPH